MGTCSEKEGGKAKKKLNKNGRNGFRSICTYTYTWYDLQRKKILMNIVCIISNTGVSEWRRVEEGEGRLGRVGLGRREGIEGSEESECGSS